MSKSLQSRLWLYSVALICLCSVSLVTHVFAEATGQPIAQGGPHHAAEHSGIPDLSESHEHGDDFIPMFPLAMALLGALAAESLTAQFTASSLFLPPLLPPPKALS